MVFRYYTTATAEEFVENSHVVKGNLVYNSRQVYKSAEQALRNAEDRKNPDLVLVALSTNYNPALQKGNTVAEVLHPNEDGSFQKKSVHDRNFNPVKTWEQMARTLSRVG